LREVAIFIDALPSVEVSPDPHDNYLLALASVGEADYLVTGDKPDLLALGRHEGTKIVSVRDFIALARL
jgi:predicted nucleic acid-binding protein